MTEKSPGEPSSVARSRVIVVRRREPADQQKVLITELRRTFPLLERCRRIMAILRLQRWFRTYVHCQRDENGWPLDPILQEGIPPERLMVISYRTYREVRPTVPTHLQALGLPPPVRYERMTSIWRFDINSLWSAIVYGPVYRPLNPLTNTAFEQNTFERILQRALQDGLVSPEGAAGYRERYRYEFERQNSAKRSRFEITAINTRRLTRQRWFLRCLEALLEHRYERCLALLGGPYRTLLEEQGQCYLTQTVPNTLGQFLYCSELDLLQLATAMGAEPVVLRLLELGAPLRRRVPCHDPEEDDPDDPLEADSEDSEEWDYTLEKYVHPLHIALYEGHAHLLPMLIAYEAATDPLLLRDLNGLSTLEIAQSKIDEHPQLLQALYDATDRA